MVGKTNAKRKPNSKKAILHIYSEKQRILIDKSNPPYETVILKKNGIIRKTFTSVDTNMIVTGDPDAAGIFYDEFIYLIDPLDFGEWVITGYVGEIERTETINIINGIDYYVNVRICFFYGYYPQMAMAASTRWYTENVAHLASIQLYRNNSGVSYSYGEGSPFSITTTSSYAMTVCATWNIAPIINTDITNSFSKVYLDAEITYAPTGDYRPRHVVRDDFYWSYYAVDKDTAANIRTWLSTRNRSTSYVDISGLSGSILFGITGRINIKIYNWYMA